MTTDKILKDYKQYIDEHKKCVEKGFLILKPFLRGFLNEEEFSLLSKNVVVHDNSKFQDDEFFSYAEYFYGDKDKAKIDFEKAKNLHKSRNPHHPEYWKNIGKEMPKTYIVEMVLDWWSFSIMKNNFGEIFDFYDKHKGELTLTENETKIVENILSAIEQSQEGLKDMPQNED